MPPQEELGDSDEWEQEKEEGGVSFMHTCPCT